MASDYNGMSLDALRALVLDTVPGTVNDAATHWQNVSTALEDLASSLEQNRLGLLEGQGWTGQAANNFYTYAQSLIDQIRQVSSGASVTSYTLGNLATQMTTAQQQMREIPASRVQQLGPNADLDPMAFQHAAQADAHSQQSAAQVMNTLAGQYDQAKSMLSGVPAQLPGSDNVGETSTRIAGPTTGSTGPTGGHTTGGSVSPYGRANLSGGGTTSTSREGKAEHGGGSTPAIAVTSPTSVDGGQNPLGPAGGGTVHAPAHAGGSAATMPPAYVPPGMPGGPGGLPAAPGGGTLPPSSGGSSTTGLTGSRGTAFGPDDGIQGGNVTRRGGPIDALGGDGITGGIARSSGAGGVGGYQTAGGGRMSASAPGSGGGLGNGAADAGASGGAEGGAMPMGGGGMGGGGMGEERRGQRPAYLTEDPDTWRDHAPVNPAVIE
jgi:hypothetical protein